MNAGSVADWVTAVATVATVGIAAYAAYMGLATFRHQRTSFDIQLALGIFEKINDYWDRIADKGHNQTSEEHKYNMGQILAQFEIAATLFNKRILTRAALPILKDHIVEVYAQLEGSAEGRALIQDCCSAPDTFKELKAFLSEHLPTALLALQYNHYGPR